MKFALIKGEKREASKGSEGICPCCGSDLIAKCGDIKINHWAHKGDRNCDKWWENETEWHRVWKGEFPREWQEIIHSDNNGEKHIADIKTAEDWIVEFQHSHLKHDERQIRSKFYKKIVWVVDGLRRKTDKKQFQVALESRPLTNSGIRRVCFPDECRLIKEWHDDNVLVFFDFKEPFLWFLYPKKSNNEAYLEPFSREHFVKRLNNNEFDEYLKKHIEPINEELARIIQERQRYRSEFIFNRFLNAPIKHQKGRHL